MSQLNSTIS